MKQNKERIRIKKDIAKGLRSSDKVLWETLSAEKQERVVDMYFNTNSIENVGIHKVLEENRNISRTLATLLLGVLLGAFGGAVANIALKYTPQSGYFDLFIVIVFFIILFMFVRMIERMNVDSLREDSVLEYFVKSLDKS